MPTKIIETQLSNVLQLAGRAFLSAVFVTSELLIHADLAARSFGSWLTDGKLTPSRIPARRFVITDRRPRGRATKLAARRALRSRRTA
jgi:hypothetical protein